MVAGWGIQSVRVGRTYKDGGRIEGRAITLTYAPRATVVATNPIFPPRWPRDGTIYMCASCMTDDVTRAPRRRRLPADGRRTGGLGPIHGCS